MNLQENIFRIKQMMGLLNEQTYMKSYSPANILDFCGYRAIEMFEETKGNPLGKTMGATYFEEKLATYETMISDNISKTIGMSTFNKFPPKLKMQIWSWMFNNTDASTGTVKWITGINQAINFDKFMNLETKEYDKQKALEYRLKVSNQGSDEYKNAILEIQAFKGDWNVVYANYLKVLDMQYISTANSNNSQGSYDNSWRYRPGDLDSLYNTCKSGLPQTQLATTGTQATTTGGAIQQTNTSSLTVQDKLKNNQTLTKEELNFKGDLNLDNSNVTSLPEGLQVDGSLSLNNCYNLTSLPKNLDVTGNLDLLGTTKLTSLPEGLAVWGFIQIKDSTLARRYTNDDLREMVGSNGNLSYINRNSLRPLSDIIGTQAAQTTGGATQPTTTGGGAATSTNNNNDELNNLVTSGITDTGVVAPFTDRPYISSGNTIYNQRKQSSTLQINPNLRRPWGDPYIYYSANTGDIYYYLCGKRRDQAGMPVVPCPKLTSSDWIKSNTSSRTNAIKTNIFKK